MFNRPLYEIQRIHRVHDGQGGWTREYHKIADERGIVALGALTVRERTREDEEEGGRERSRIKHVGYFRSGIDLGKSDRIVNSAGDIFEVVSRRNPGDRARVHEFELMRYLRGR